MREVLAYCMIMGMSAAFLWHFSNIARFGTHLIQEPSPVILALEILLFCAVFIFGLVSLINKSRGGNKHGN